MVVAQLGARMHYAVPQILHARGLLAHFFTDLCAVKGWPRLTSLLPNVLLPNAVRRMVGRVPGRIPGDRITAFTAFGVEYALRVRRARTSREQLAAFLWSGETFCDLIIRAGLGDAAGVYTFNTAGLELLRHARARGLKTVMEQTIAPQAVEKMLMGEEQARHPDWQLKVANDDLSAELAARERAEWDEADLILCGSQFVADGIASCGGPVDRCRVVPYGVSGNFRARERRRPEGKLRVLTVGEVGLRKGSPYVREAARRLKGKAEFRMVGQINILPRAAAQLRQEVELIGAIPRREILTHFDWADVFLLPSLCEGSATVTYEALACGLPVICTHNTGSVVRHGEDGLIVPLRDWESIVEAMEALAASPDLLRTFSENAMKRAREVSLDAYAERLVTALEPGNPNTVTAWSLNENLPDRLRV